MIASQVIAKVRALTYLLLPLSCFSFAPQYFASHESASRVGMLEIYLKDHNAHMVAWHHGERMRQEQARAAAEVCAHITDPWTGCKGDEGRHAHAAKTCITRASLIRGKGISWSVHQNPCRLPCSCAAACSHLAAYVATFSHGVSCGAAPIRAGGLLGSRALRAGANNTTTAAAAAIKRPAAPPSTCPYAVKPGPLHSAHAWRGRCRSAYCTQGCAEGCSPW